MSSLRLFNRQVKYPRALVAALGLASMLVSMQPASPVYAATFIVTTTADSGPGSLRQAIISANATSKADTIRFSIPGPSPFTITLGSDLPAIIGPVIIDGASQPTVPGTLGIRLNGGGFACLSLGAGSQGSTVKGLAIGGCSGAGIHLANSGKNTIQGNYLGTLDGLTAAPNGFGIQITGSPNNQIGGTLPSQTNLVSGNSGTGIQIDGAGAIGNKVQGNRIGVNIYGTAALANVGVGVNLADAPGNTIGGATAGAGNVIAANSYGVYVDGSASTGNVIQGNFVGTDAAGTVDLGNNFSGVEIALAPNNLIGGAVPGAGNVISGNGAGIAISSATGNVVQGNTIGADVTGALSLGNDQSGVTVSNGASNTTIGGAAPGAGNLIANNSINGMTVTNNSLDAVIQRNRIENNTFNGLAVSNNATILTNSLNCFEGNGTTGMANGNLSNTFALNNWWGDASGPTHATNPGGTGQTVGSDITFTPWSTSSCEATVTDPINNGGMEVNANADLLPDAWIGKGLKLSASTDGLDCVAGGALGTSPCAFRFNGNNKLKSFTQSMTVSGAAADAIDVSLATREDSVPATGGKYRVTVTVYHNDGSKQVSVFDVPVALNIWTQHAMPTVLSAEPYKKIDFKFEFQKSAGNAWLDDVSIAILP